MSPEKPNNSKSVKKPNQGFIRDKECALLWVIQVENMDDQGLKRSDSASE